MFESVGCLTLSFFPVVRSRMFLRVSLNASRESSAVPAYLELLKDVLYPRREGKCTELYILLPCAIFAPLAFFWFAFLIDVGLP